MYRIIDKKSSGKTKKLMYYAKDNNALFVCKNPDKMKEKAITYGIVGVEFISYDDFLYNGNIAKSSYVIDEVEEYLKYSFNEIHPDNNFIGYNLSSED